MPDHERSRKCKRREAVRAVRAEGPNEGGRPPAAGSRKAWIVLVSLGTGALLLGSASAAYAQQTGLLGEALADLEALTSDPAKLTPAFRLAILMTLLSLAPALVMMLTCFVRIVIVLTLLRQAIGVATVPPTQVLIALALFLTLFVMQETFSTAYSKGVGPFLRGEVEDTVAFEATVAPFREYMLRQTRDEDLLLFEEISNKPLPDDPAELGLATLTPAYMLSELRTAFMIGFMLFLPFLVVDMVVASTLLSMGMIVVPPIMISLPLKLMIFVLVDGWNLVVGALVRGLV
ncbi:MAG: flagellar type III secretion system pore protein FliP [Myxococcota bacterium]